jgi:5'-3' exonuclease
MITGDATDNIQGIPGLGPVAAEHLDAFTTEEEMGEAVLELYSQEYGPNEEDVFKAFLENAQLLWIRRKPGELWTPNYNYKD